MADREAQAGAVGAGREERLEDARQIVGADAAAAIHDLDRDLTIVTAAPGFDASAALSTRLTRTWRRRAYMPTTPRIERAGSTRASREGPGHGGTPCGEDHGVRKPAPLSVMTRGP